VIQLFYGIAAMNALFSSMAWCAAKPNRWSILPLAPFAVIWPFVNGDLGRRRPSYAAMIAFIQAVSIRAAVRRNPSAEHRDITENLRVIHHNTSAQFLGAEPALLPLHTVSSSLPENPGQPQGTTGAKAP